MLLLLPGNKIYLSIYLSIRKLNIGGEGVKEACYMDVRPDFCTATDKRAEYGGEGREHASGFERIYADIRIQ